MNAIPERQNEPRQIERLAAQRCLYGRVKFVIGVQITLAVLPPLIFSILMLMWPGLKLFATLSSLIVTLLDFGFLDPLYKHWRKTAAQIQEAFDCDVLEINWTTLRAGKQPPPEEVMRYATRIVSDEAQISRLREWYPAVIGELPIELGRLICQRTNCQWDATLKATYSWYLTLFLWTAAVTVCLLGGIANPSFEGFVLAMLAPVTPVVVLALRQYREYSDSAKTSEQLRQHVDDLWDRAVSKKLRLSDLTPESRTLQSEIFLRRATTAPVFNWLYNLLAKQQQTFADRTADDLVKEAKERLALSDAMPQVDSTERI